MKTPVKVVLLSFLSLAVVGTMIHLFSPNGLPALIDKLVPKSWFNPETRPAAPRVSPAGAHPAVSSAAIEETIREAERAYDGGDFVHALDLYEAALAGDQGQRDRAVRGRHRAILAWALTANVALPNPLPDDREGELARKQAAAEASPSERAWYDATIFAAGIGASKKLAYLAQQTMATALPNGPAEERLRRVLSWAGSRANPLHDAMVAEGLLEPVDPVAAAATPRRPATRPPAPVARVPLQVPGGRFSEGMKKRLATAVELEQKGAAEHELTGPDEPNRREHRKAALEYLIQARDIYDAALEEDARSPSLDRRLHDVLEMISQLRKELTIGD